MFAFRLDVARVRIPSAAYLFRRRLVLFSESCEAEFEERTRISSLGEEAKGKQTLGVAGNGIQMKNCVWPKLFEMEINLIKNCEF